MAPGSLSKVKQKQADSIWGTRITSRKLPDFALHSRISLVTSYIDILVRRRVNVLYSGDTSGRQQIKR